MGDLTLLVVASPLPRYKTNYLLSKIHFKEMSGLIIGQESLQLDCKQFTTLNMTLRMLIYDALINRNRHNVNPILPFISTNLKTGGS